MDSVSTRGEVSLCGVVGDNRGFGAEGKAGGLPRETGGRFYTVEDPQGLQDAYERISAAEPLSETDVYLMPQKELYPYPLFVSLGLFSLNVFIAAAKRLRAKGGENG